MKGIFTTGKGHNIYWMISLAVLVCASITTFPYHVDAVKSLSLLSFERNVSPEIFLNRIPSDMAVNFEGTVFVSHPHINALSIIDENTLKISTIPVGSWPTGLAVDDLRNLVFVANRDSNTISVIQQTSEGYRNIANVTSGGNHPYDVFADVENGIVYVMNADSKYPVSIVGDPTGDWRNLKNISLEDSSNIRDIAVSGGITYVGRSYSPSNHTVSVIEGLGNLEGGYKNVANVSVGFSPDDIVTSKNDPISIPYAFVTSKTNTNIVSIIGNTEYPGRYRNIENITVGDSILSIFPNDIGVSVSTYESVSFFEPSYVGGPLINVANISVGDSPFVLSGDNIGRTVYVAKYRGGVSVIDLRVLQIQVGVSFEVEPFHAGQVECYNNAVPTNQYFYIDFTSKCQAKANEGFQFSSWSEDLGNNSTRIINASTASNSPIDWLADALRGGTNDTTATLTPTKFGKFVARFEEVPPPFPPEYLIPLYGIIASSIVGWSIPSIVSWINAKRKGKMSDEYHKRIQSLYNDGKLDRADVKPLNEIRNELSDTYAKGKISEQQYQNLKGETGVLYEEIHRKRIDFLNGPLKHNSRYDRLLTTIKQDIDDDFAKGKISKEHYDLLNKKIESFVNSEENKTH